jgi:hypothetical protein
MLTRTKSYVFIVIHISQNHPNFLNFKAISFQKVDGVKSVTPHKTNTLKSYTITTYYYFKNVHHLNMTPNHWV